MITKRFGISPLPYPHSFTLWMVLIWLYTCGIQPAMSAQEMPIPLRIQAATFSKMFKYDNSLQGKNPIRVLIVFDDKTKTVKKELESAFRSSSIETSAVTSEMLEQTILNSDVVYFMPGMEDQAHLCKKYKKLSIAGIATYAVKGDVSITVGLENNYPRLMVNMTSLISEGHDLSAGLMKFVKLLK
ncbi:MAG: hypothetical protein KBA26_03715 [Candidatus Delongbacteria bacterium]|nr:hypothetical protein [Candidatus Delongbacteria bacterium]